MASTATTKTNGKTPTSADLANQLAEVKSDLADLAKLMAEFGRGSAREVQSDVRARAEAAREQVAEKVETAKETVRETYEAAHKRAEDLGAQAQDYIRSQPGTALGIAAGVGFLIGLMAARR